MAPEAASMATGLRSVNFFISTYNMGRLGGREQCKRGRSVRCFEVAEWAVIVF